MGIMNLSQIMDKSIDILREKVKTIVLFALAYMGITIAGGLVGTFIISIIMIITVIGAIESNNPTGIIIAMILLLTVIFTVIKGFGVGIIEVCSEKFFRKNVDTSQALKVSFKNFFKVFCINIIMAISAVPVGFVIYGIIRLLFEIIVALDFVMVIGRWMIVVCILLIMVLTLLITGIVVAFLTIFAFTSQAITIENVGPLKAIKRSWTLVKNNYWKVFGLSILFFLTVKALGTSMESLVYLVISIIYFIMKLLGVDADLIVVMNLINLQIQLPMRVLSLMIITPINTIMMTMLYFNLRIKHEGFDMRLRLREIQKDNERKQASEVTTFNRHF